MTEKHERLKFWANLLAPLVGAIVLGVAGLWIQTRIAEAANAREYVQVALEILRDDSTPAVTPETREIRNWAVGVFVKYSPVPLTDHGEKALRNEGLPRKSALQAELAYTDEAWAKILSGENCGGKYSVTRDAQAYKDCLEAKGEKLPEGFPGNPPPPSN